MTRQTPAFGRIDDEYAGRLATWPPDRDGPIWMVNFMRYREWADYGAPGDRTISGREADDRYAPVDVLRRLGAEIAYFGDVVGDDDRPDPVWHRMGVVLYPTRRSFIDMQARPDFREKYVHKKAGMAFTIIAASLPLGPPRGEPDGSGIVRFTLFPTGSRRSGPVDEGVLFEVEGTPIGDDRQWERLEVSWSDRAEPLPEGAMRTRSVPLIDRMRELVGASTRG